MTAGSSEGAATGYSLQDAAAIVGVSVNTLRKRIRAGQVRAERVQRPQGYVWQVYLHGRHSPGQLASGPPIQEAPKPKPRWELHGRKQGACGFHRGIGLVLLRGV
jgi:hypothetical protein